jgi:hypothetical protein
MPTSATTSESGSSINEIAPSMARNSFRNDYNSTQFPFEFISSEFGEELSVLLGKIEDDDIKEPHAVLVVALNTVLVWSRARTATLPSWQYFKTWNELMMLINYLNKWSRVPDAGRRCSKSDTLGISNC